MLFIGGLRETITFISSSSSIDKLQSNVKLNSKLQQLITGSLNIDIYYSKTFKHVILPIFDNCDRFPFIFRRQSKRHYVLIHVRQSNFIVTPHIVRTCAYARVKHAVFYFT